VALVDEWPDVDIAVPAPAGGSPLGPAIEAVGSATSCDALREVIEPPQADGVGIRIASEPGCITAGGGQRLTGASRSIRSRRPAGGTGQFAGSPSELGEHPLQRGHADEESPEVEVGRREHRLEDHRLPEGDEIRGPVRRRWHSVGGVSSRAARGSWPVDDDAESSGGAALCVERLAGRRLCTDSFEDSPFQWLLSGGLRALSQSTKAFAFSSLARLELHHGGPGPPESTSPENSSCWSCLLRRSIRIR
jgi:hypothetical protein